MNQDDQQPPADPSPSGLPGHLDQWMAQSVWHPRVTPFFVYLLGLWGVGAAREAWPSSYPFAYALQCGIVGWLIWRYRKLMPELNLKFHWLALPVGAGVCVAWIVLGRMMVAAFPGQFAGDEAHFLQDMPPTLRRVSLGFRLLGMSIIVPLLEEPFVRSLLLRATARAGATAIATFQLLLDIPVLGDMLLHSKWALRAEKHEHIMQHEFENHPHGRLTLFGVVLSTVVFMSYHTLRDQPAALVCGLAYCALVAATAKRGLGPVIWAHGITNAMLWGYTIYYNDWQFL